MSDADALCYRSKYSDIKAYGDDLEKIKSHYDKHGSWEGGVTMVATRQRN